MEINSIRREAEALRILANVCDLPVGETLILPDLARDGMGGVTVKRSRKDTYVFQREFDRSRSRWADNAGEALEEIEYYVRSGGRLTPPAKAQGF